MDSRSFDAYARSLAAFSSRRAALGTTLAGALGTLSVGWLGTEAKKRNRKRKKKKKCRGCPVCKECVKGKCRPLPDFTPCGGVCQECQGGACANKADDTTCDEEGKCLDGVCNPLPDCISANVGGCEVLQNCCSDICEVPPPGGVCQPGAARTPCKDNTDCQSESCIGYRCAE